jgi:glyoxylase-like metal-dependent hydrolase (beta-lactamase superfamily II)
MVHFLHLKSIVTMVHGLNRMRVLPGIFVILMLLSCTTAARTNFLKDCWKRQVKPVGKKFLVLTFHESLNELQHSFEPWQQTNSLINGVIRVNAAQFHKQDTMRRGKREYYSQTSFSNAGLLFLDYGDKDLYPVTSSMVAEQVFKSARYSPIGIVNYFYAHRIASSHEEAGLAVYTATIHKTIVSLYIGLEDKLLHKLTTLHHDELFGDVLTTIHYGDFSAINGLCFPRIISIGKVNGRIKDEVTLSSAVISATVPVLLTRPAGTGTVVESKEDKPELASKKYSDHIYFIELKHSDDRVLLVEFSDFLFVAEAPLNSTNGELIIAEAKKLAPGKPVKYFAFGHYHPHYIGGVRPFIHKGATIITTKGDEEFVRYLAAAKHSLEPDSLQIQPRPLKTETINDSLEITDGKMVLKLFVIGERSEHTRDYLIYYFPGRKLLFEDDLAWIKKDGIATRASGRQAGLYHAIMELHLDVQTIVQSWPVNGYGVKTEFSFADLESSMLVK